MSSLFFSQFHCLPSSSSSCCCENSFSKNSLVNAIDPLGFECGREDCCDEFESAVVWFLGVVLGIEALTDRGETLVPTLGGWSIEGGLA